MKLDNTGIHNEINNNSNKFNPDRILDTNSIEIVEKSEIVVKIAEKLEYNPDALIEKGCGNGKVNKEIGCKREEEVAKELEKQYPEDKGYKILSECTLRDRNGDTVKDKAGDDESKRRVDFAVVKDGKVVDMVEVTSKNATKTDQMKKEYNIRANGGNYIKNRETGDLYRIPDNVNTRIERRD